MSGVVSGLIKDVPLPGMARVRQVFPRPKIEAGSIPGEIQAILEREEFSAQIKPGMRIAITAGSRGIANIALITKAIADFCKGRGAYPFVFPAMGSHGGATAEGQSLILEHYGITEDYLGCPILSGMETVEIGRTKEGQPVLIDKYASEADGIIVAGRVKPHTCFRGTYESGIMKMLAIGLGKQQGADNCHHAGFGKMAHYVPLFGNAIIKHANILFALAIIENAYDETYRLEGIMPGDIADTEPALLKDAYAHMPKILIDECDLLIVDQIGKNFSGDGMDPNITGTFCTPYAEGGIKAQRVTVLGLTPETGGNAMGIGMAHATTRRVFNRMDFDVTYPNSITSKVLEMSRVPMVMKNDREAIQICLRSCSDIDHSNPRIVRIANSLHIDNIYISSALLEEAKAADGMEIISGPEPFPFDADGNLF
ncbi:MAG: lactate racemase domain-containing protein [Oscillospiraceae bacterium]|nr:lactate racemase domain-containing protein [Oscillospiraceae bacterium]